VIKIFLATPSDLNDARQALSELIKDINDILTFLAPEKRLSLELVRYETHAYPDVGQPQEVINRQIPLDYDVLIGSMWRRSGTPTKAYAGGTIEEFWRAYKHREESHGRSPIIMLYFCDQFIPIPTAAELEQLQGVVAFRDQVRPLGYTISYQARENFREVVQPGLLRAIRSLLQSDPARLPPDSRIPLETAPVELGVRQLYLSLAGEYEQLRKDMPSGHDRTRRMAAVFSRMLAAAGSVSPLFNELKDSPSAGQRLGAIAILHVLPSVEYLDWLANRLDLSAERPFIGYQAAVGLLQAVRSLPVSDCQALRAALVKARSLVAELITNDRGRLRVLEAADRELTAKCGAG
jgi:hypothetical protein